MRSPSPNAVRRITDVPWPGWRGGCGDADGGGHLEHAGGVSCRERTQRDDDGLTHGQQATVALRTRRQSLTRVRGGGTYVFWRLETCCGASAGVATSRGPIHRDGRSQAGAGRNTYAACVELRMGAARRTHSLRGIDSPDPWRGIMPSFHLRHAQRGAERSAASAEASAKSGSGPQMRGAGAACAHSRRAWLVWSLSGGSAARKVS